MATVASAAVVNGVGVAVGCQYRAAAKPGNTFDGAGMLIPFKSG